MADSKVRDIELSTVFEKEAVSSTSPHELILLTTIKGPIVENEARDSRAPIDLVAVIDRSGSMSGDKLELVLKTMEFVVEQLKEEDQLSIVAYDTEVLLPLPFTFMTVAGKKSATEQLSKIKANSSTNLSGGLLKGIEQLIGRTEKNDVASIMLFTDGRANMGLTRTTEIVRAINVNIEKVDTACSIFTFGFGSDHDESMLKEIAEAGKGLYYFIETLDDIPKSFGDCLGGLLAVSAQNITIKLEGVDGVVMKTLLSRVKGSENAQGKQVELVLGDIYSEESRDIAAVFVVPSLSAPNEENFPAVNITLSYFNVHTASLSQKTLTAYLKRPLETPPNQPVNVYIDKQKNRLRAIEAMDQASKLKGDKASRAQGRELLQSTINDLKQSVSSNEKFTRALVADVETSLNELQDHSYDYSSYQKKMAQKASAHSRQRGHNSASFYDNSSKTQMKEKASYVSMDFTANKSISMNSFGNAGNSSSSSNSNNSSSNNNNNSNNNNDSQ